MTSADKEFALDLGGSKVAWHRIVVSLYSSGMCINFSDPSPLPMGLKSALTFGRFASVLPFKSHSILVMRSELEVSRTHVKVALELGVVTTFPGGNRSTVYSKN